MAQTFRSQFNGFHREDVVRYLDYLNNKHITQLNQLNAELEALRTQQTAADTAPQEEEIARLTQLNEQLQEESTQLAQQITQLQEEKAQLAEELDALCNAPVEAAPDTALAEENARLQAQLAAITAERDALLTRETCHQNRSAQELEAYRRAEQTERVARERAQTIYRCANGALSDAAQVLNDSALQVADAANLIDASVEQVMTQLLILRQAAGSSRNAMQQAAARVNSLAPGEHSDF